MSMLIPAVSINKHLHEAGLKERGTDGVGEAKEINLSTVHLNNDDKNRVPTGESKRGVRFLYSQLG